jgi:hypothetical protein
MMKKEIDINYMDLQAAILHDRDIANREGFKHVANRAEVVLAEMRSFVNDPENVGKSIKVTIVLERKFG